jgi:hypothetical protein
MDLVIAAFLVSVHGVSPGSLLLVMSGAKTRFALWPGMTIWNGH